MKKYFKLTKNRKYDDAGEDGSSAVDDGHEDGVPVAVVPDGHVGGEGDETAERQTEREEDLSGGVQPHLGVRQSAELENRIINH